MKELLDEVDLQIIRLLQNDGRMASSEIAKTIGIPEATIRYRLKKLIDKEFIQIVDTAFIRRIVRERFGFGTPKYLTESDKEADTIKPKKRNKIKKTSKQVESTS